MILINTRASEVTRKLKILKAIGMFFSAKRSASRRNHSVGHRRWITKGNTHDFHILDGRQESLYFCVFLYDEHLLDGFAEILLSCAHGSFSGLVEQLLADAIEAAFKKALNRWIRVSRDVIQGLLLGLTCS